MFRGTTIIAGLLTAALTTGAFAQQQSGRQHQDQQRLQDPQRQLDRQDQRFEGDRAAERMISLYGEVRDVRKERHLGEEHLHVYVRTEDDRTIKADLGPAQDVEEVDRQLRRGDEVTILGQAMEIDGERTLVAHRVTIADETYTIDRWAHEHDARPARFREEDRWREAQRFRDQRWRDDEVRFRDDERRDRIYYGDDPRRPDRQAEWRIGQRDQPLREQHFEARDERWREEQVRFREDRFGEDRLREDRIREDRLRDDRAREERFREHRIMRDDREAPAGFLMIRELAVLRMGDAPQQHFQRAHQFMQQDNHHAAAEETRLAATYLEMQAARADRQMRRELEEVADQLEEFADHVERGEVEDRQMRQSLARANHVLAKHHQRQAERALDDERALAAAYDLRSSARTLQHAAAWAQQPLEGEAQEAVQQAQQASQELMASARQMKREQRQARFEADGVREREDEAMPAAARERERDRERWDRVRDREREPRVDRQLLQEAEQASARLEQAIEQVGRQIERARAG